MLLLLGLEAAGPAEKADFDDADELLERVRERVDVPFVLLGLRLLLLLLLLLLLRGLLLLLLGRRRRWRR